jgi:hypothetical protein
MTVCGICLCQIGKKRYKTVCNHKFHYKCILKWVINNETCPLCRRIIRDLNQDYSIEIEDLERTRDIFFFLARLIDTSI